MLASPDRLQLAKYRRGLLGLLTGGVRIAFLVQDFGVAEVDDGKSRMWIAISPARCGLFGRFPLSAHSIASLIRGWNAPTCRVGISVRRPSPQRHREARRFRCALTVGYYHIVIAGRDFHRRLFEFQRGVGVSVQYSVLSSVSMSGSFT